MAQQASINAGTLDIGLENEEETNKFMKLMGVKDVRLFFP